MEFDLKNYSTDDKEFVYYVKKVVYQKYVEENYGEWNEKKQREIFDRFLKESLNDIKIILIGTKKIGFINGKLIDSMVYELGNICILPEFQGQGIGTKILNDIINQNKGKDITLRVFKQNPAKKLYERLGFEVYDETSFHYTMKRKYNFGLRFEK